MKKAIILAWLTCSLVCEAQAGDAAESNLVGTWGWHHIRHEQIVTYTSDGTYKRESSSSSDGGIIHTDTGTWKIEGNKLIETSSKKGSFPTSSVIKFEGKNRFQLDDFMDFERLT